MLNIGAGNPHIRFRSGGNQADIDYLMGVMSLLAVTVQTWISNLVDNVVRKNNIALASSIDDPCQYHPPVYH